MRPESFAKSPTIELAPVPDWPPLTLLDPVVELVLGTDEPVLNPVVVAEPELFEEHDANKSATSVIETVPKRRPLRTVMSVRY